MCGLSFILDPAGGALPAKLRRMHDLIQHRGPDGDGFAIVTRSGLIETARIDDRDDAVAGLAFRRLKILDLSEAAMQPMIGASGTTVLLFNGEIYNFRALRDELRSRGRSFRTSGDTEVVLAAFEEWGNACFARFEGMWAIIVVDLDRRRVVASRDRFGIKPLHWARAGTALMLASEAKQIVNAFEGRVRANAARVALHLRGQRYPVTYETFFEGIHVVPPATFFEMPLDGEVRDPVFTPYWRLADFTARSDRTYAEAVDAFENVLRAAVRSHHVADVGIGSLLSGGLDSSMITTLLADIGREEERKFPTFSFGFRGEHESFSELQYADAVVRQQALVNFETSFDAVWVAENSAAVVRAIEEPPLAMSVLAQYRTFELCRQHGSTVILDGQGSDEILGGYPYHQRMALIEAARRRRFGDLGRELRAIAARNGVSAAGQLFDYFGRPALRRLDRPVDVVARGYGAGAHHDEIRSDASTDASAINRRAYYDVRWGNVRIILDYADRNAMAHSIEARVPFFDRQLVEFAFSLPAEFKVSNGDRKRILRDVARRRLPAAITERPDRMGFATPEASLIAGPLRDQITNRILGSRVQRHSSFDRKALRQVTTRFARGADEDLRLVWRIFTLALWLDAFDVSEA